MYATGRGTRIHRPKLGQIFTLVNKPKTKTVRLFSGYRTRNVQYTMNATGENRPEIEKLDINLRRHLKHFVVLVPV